MAAVVWIRPLWGNYVAVASEDCLDRDVRTLDERVGDVVLRWDELR